MIIITGYSDVRIAVELIRRGAFDYVVKPLYPDEILNRVEEALASKHGKSTTQEPATGTKPTTEQRAYVKGTGSRPRMKTRFGRGSTRSSWSGER